MPSHFAGCKMLCHYVDHYPPECHGSGIFHGFPIFGPAVFSGRASVGVTSARSAARFSPGGDSVGDRRGACPGASIMRGGRQVDEPWMVPPDSGNGPPVRRRGRGPPGPDEPAAARAGFLGRRDRAIAAGIEWSNRCCAPRKALSAWAMPSAECLFGPRLGPKWSGLKCGRNNYRAAPPARVRREYRGVCVRAQHLISAPCCRIRS
jgi:hypothetical protein